MKLMSSYIDMQKIWEDPDMYELAVAISDGRSTFSTDIYVGKTSAIEIVEGLSAFAPQLHGGLYDLRVGEFGPEYASGALHLRFGFHPSGSGRIDITARCESDWSDGPRTLIASSATLHLRTEPALFDEFFRQFKALAKGQYKEARLRCI